MTASAHPGDDTQRRGLVRTLVASARRQAAASVVRPGRAPRWGVAAGPIDLPGYDIIAEVHRGGQGVVYQALQRSTRRKVAIKVMKEGPFAGPSERLRFDREVQILGALNHPHIVTIHDTGSTAGSFYFVMDYVSGEPLDAYFAKSPRSVDECLRLFVRVCEAVQAAHLLGVIHRDLKPGNIRVDEAGDPHILDFGLAKVVGGPDTAGVTVAGQFLGSLPWASPEQAAGHFAELDRRTDVYSLGVILYQLLTGRFPYEVVGSMHAVLEQIMRVEPVRPSTIRRRIDGEVETIILKCLSKDPARRYQTAGELARDIRHYLAGDPIEAKRDSGWYILRKTARRYRMPLTVAAAFIVVLIASTIVAWTLSVREMRARREATEAGQRAVGNLHDALVAQARALRQKTDAVGQRRDAMAALKKAAEIRPSLAARNEAIAALALPDMQSVRRIAGGGAVYLPDPTLTHCVVVNADISSRVIRFADEAELLRLATPQSGMRGFYYQALHGHRLLRVYDPPVGDRRLEIWTVPEGILEFELDDLPFRSRPDFSPDGNHLAVGRADQAIHIYDLNTGDAVRRLPLDRNPSYLAYDPSGRRLALYHADFERAELLDLETGARQPVFESQNIGWSAAWHPEGRILAGASGTRIELWDTQSRRSLGVLAGHEMQIVDLKFSPDGTLLLSHSWDGLTVLWDPRSQRALLKMSLGNPFFFSGGSQIAGVACEGRDCALEFFQLELDSPRRRLIAWDDTEQPVGMTGQFDPQTGLLFTADRLETFGAMTSTLRVFDPLAGHELARHLVRPPASWATDPAGRFFLVSGNPKILKWPVSSESDRATLGPPLAVGDTPVGVRAVALNASGASLLIGDTAKCRFTVLNTVNGDTRTIVCGSTWHSARLSPDGRWIAVGENWGNGSGGVWSVETGQRVAAVPSLGAVEFSRGGDLLVGTAADGLAVWETATWRPVRRSSLQPSYLWLSPDDRLLAGSGRQKQIALLDFSTLEELATLEPPESYPTMNCAFSPDGALLAQLTGRNGVVHLWDLRELRARLAEIGLDWDLPAYPAASPQRDWRPGDMVIESQSPPGP